MSNIEIFLKNLELSEDNFKKIFLEVKESIEQGVANANSNFINDPEQFDFRGARAIYTTSSVKKLFRKTIYTNEDVRSLVKHIRSHGVDYFLINGKILLCIKKMDNKGRVSSFYSKRFQQTINGGKVSYSVKMLNLLSELGIKKPLPICFAGYVLNKSGRLDNMFLVNYKHGKVENVVSLKVMFEPNLFNITTDKVEKENISDLVMLKKKANPRRVSNS